MTKPSTHPPPDTRHPIPDTRTPNPDTGPSARTNHTIATQNFATRSKILNPCHTRVYNHTTSGGDTLVRTDVTRRTLYG